MSIWLNLIYREVNIESIFGRPFTFILIARYLPYYNYKECDEYAKNLNDFIERASGAHDVNGFFLKIGGKPRL